MEKWLIPRLNQEKDKMILEYLQIARLLKHDRDMSEGPTGQLEQTSYV